jgi:hypothetical protein
MPPAIGTAGGCGQVPLHVQERSSGNVPFEIELTPMLWVAELPPAIDELVPHP